MLPRPARAHALCTLFGVALTGCLAAPEYVESSAALTTVQQGVDRAGVFSASEATSLKSAYGISFSGVYIGGPCSAGSGWTAASVKTIAAATGWRFLPIFVGQQASSICGRDTLTEAQGITDGKSGVTLMGDFEWAANDHIPLALDLEAGSYSGDPSAAVAYVKGFADTVSAAGYDVYVYSSVTALNALAAAKLPITGAWPAYWLQTNGGFKSGLTPSQAPGLSSTWSGGGAWQYNSGSSVVGSVDYDVADFVLAPTPGTLLPLPDAGPTGADGGAANQDAAPIATADAGEHVDAGTADLAGAGQPGNGGNGGSGGEGASVAGGCAMSGAPRSAPGGIALLGLLLAMIAIRRRQRA